MIRKTLDGGTLIAKFGRGTVHIKQHLLQSRYGGQVQLTPCRKSKIGKDVAKDNIFKNPKIVLDFGSVESLQVLINKLEELKADMIEGVENEQVEKDAGY